ncbi:hypothetical protein ABIC22_000030 [Paenibacillus sp. PvP094]|uniref:hypothetical protein n=1 Tax=Paenibacillus sp. PvP094 TaxID=3156394 RepID=UPI00339A91B5
MGVQAVAHIDSYRGDSMNAPYKPHEGNIVQTITSGSTTIHFCDDFVIKDVTTVAEILKRYERIGWDIFQSKRE